MARFSKIRIKKTNNLALDNNADVFSWKSWKKKRKFSIYEINISDKNGPTNL